MNKRGPEHKFNREIDDCQTVNESVMGDTILGSSTERNNLKLPRLEDSNTIEEYKREIERLKVENEKVRMEKEIMILKKQVEEGDKNKIKKPKPVNKNKKAKKKAKVKKGKLEKKYKEDTTKDEPVEINADLKEPEVQLSVEMIPSWDSEDKPIKKVSDAESDKSIGKLDDSFGAKKEDDVKQIEDKVPPKIKNSSSSDYDEEIIIEEEDKIKEKIDPGFAEPAPIIPDNVRPQSFNDEKHEFSIQPVLKRKTSEKKQDLCWECNRILSKIPKLICSICEDYNLCEICESRTTHEHVFIKVPPGVEFNLDAYEKFCQKMLGLNNEPSVDFKTQMAIINPQIEKENIKIAPMMKKRAQNLNKDKYSNGIVVNTGELVKLSWEVKNMTNNPWSENMIMAVSNTSDLMLNEIRIENQLRSNEKGTVEVNFMMPKDLMRGQNLQLNMYLFDLDQQRPIGEFFTAKLVVNK